MRTDLLKGRKNFLFEIKSNDTTQPKTKSRESDTECSCYIFTYVLGENIAMIFGVADLLYLIIQ